MSRINRREFLRTTTGALGAVAGVQFLGCSKPDASPSTPAAAPRLPAGVRATDTVMLGKTGIKPSRLSIGTGTMGGKEQRDQGIGGMVKVFRHGLDQGVRWWDTADMYRTHPHVAATLKEIKRDQVVITSKTRSSDADGVRKDLERFRREMDSDYIDIVLLHCMQAADWPQKMQGPMDALSEAKAKGWVRAVGCSCHTLVALQSAANEPWVEVDLARINPFAVKMDVQKPDEVPQVERVLQSMTERGKAVYGMKIVGEGAFKGEQIDASLRFALSRPYVSGFTIGFSGNDQIDDMIRRIERIGQAA